MEQLTIVLGQKYIFNILATLAEKPRRFSDLDIACPSEKTRTNKLKVLTDTGLIETEAGRKGKRSFIYYKLTEKGKSALALADSMNKLSM